MKTVADLLLSTTLSVFCQSVNIWQSCGQECLVAVIWLAIVSVSVFLRHPIHCPMRSESLQPHSEQSNRPGRETVLCAGWCLRMALHTPSGKEEDPIQWPRVTEPCMTVARCHWAVYDSGLVSLSRVWQWPGINEPCMTVARCHWAVYDSGPVSLSRVWQWPGVNEPCMTVARCHWAVYETHRAVCMDAVLCRMSVRRDLFLQDAFSKVMAISKKDLQKAKLFISFTGEEGYVWTVCTTICIAYITYITVRRGMYQLCVCMTYILEH